jgi:type IX secretion system PorP/SprF family membrane protein
MKRITLILAVLLFSGVAFAQQQVLFTQYMFNQMAINPAYTGIHEGISTSFLWREQWVGFEGAPRTQTASIHTPISFRPISVGMMVMRDQIGITTQNSANFTYAYRLKFGNTRLSLGLQASFNFYKTDYNQDARLDPILANANINVTRPNFGTGIMWHSDKFYLGASVPTLINQKFDPSNPDSDSELVRHYFFAGGYVFALHDNLLIKPNFLLKAVQGAPLQADLNVNVLLQRLVWVGVSYRSLESLAALIQLQIGPKFQLGYGFDFVTLTDLSTIQAGSHEIMLNYIIQMPRTKILTPRYF